MKSICIKTNNEDSINCLLNKLKNDNLKHIYFSCHKFKVFTNIIIHYTGDDLIFFIKYLSDTFSSLVLNLFELDIAESIINQEYFYFNKFEKISILEKIKNNKDDISSFEKKKSILYNTFFNYFKEHNKLYLKGFITFRLKPYYKELENLVDFYINQYVIEKEYNDFVELLRLYVQSRSSISEKVYLLYKKNNPILLDKNKNIIPTEINTLNCKYLSDISFSSSDKILNTLLNILPRKIYIDLVDNKIDDFLNTLKLIFENRVEFI